jgi:hypothetical protein
VFSEPVSNVSAGTFQLAHGGIPDFGTVTYTAPLGMATFEPNVPLKPSTVYTAQVLTDITDLAGNRLAGLTTWQFTTVPDTTPPTLTSRLPSPDQTGVSVGSRVSVVFSEEVTGVTSSSFTLSDGTTTVPATVAYSSSPARAALTPNLQLAANTSYTVALDTTILDQAGNALAPTTWMFTTGPDVLSPSVVSSTPIDSQTGVSVNSTIMVRFDEAVQNVDVTSFTVDGGGAITGTIAMTMGNTVASFTPASPLPAGATITVSLSAAITDTSTNALSMAPVTFAFQTAP